MKNVYILKKCLQFPPPARSSKKKACLANFSAFVRFRIPGPKTKPQTETRRDFIYYSKQKKQRCELKTKKQEKHKNAKT